MTNTNPTDRPPRNLVVCMDGTGNAPKASGNTNVLRLFGMLEHDDADRQIAFYTPGVGTRGDPAALTGPVRLATKLRGLVTGYGMRRDISDAYTFLVTNWKPGDRIFIFGFSRGAFAALALAGICRLFGLLRPGSANMVGHVVSAVSKPLRKTADIASFKFRQRFSRKSVGGKHLPHAWVAPVHFIGVWDTVKALKYFKFVTRLKEGWLKKWYHPAWPFTASPSKVTTIRHAVCIDDRRIPYDVFTLRPAADVDFEEVWFAGVHSDVGGGFDQKGELGLGRITLKWMVEAAVSKGLLLKPGAYEDKCDVTDYSDSPIHRNSVFWYTVGFRRRLARRPFRRRFFAQPFWRWSNPPPDETLLMHGSVADRADYELPGRIKSKVVDREWRQPRPPPNTTGQ